MTANEPKVAVRRRGDVAVLDIVGDIDRTADAPLQQAYDQAVTDGGQAVLLNFGEVDYINSTGIAVIVSLLARARKERRVISAYGLTEHYRHIFSITRLSDFIGIYQDEDTAMGSAGAEGAHATPGGTQ
jgi:anti-anti-sigma factor